MADDDAESIQCAVCGATMRLVHVTPRVASLHELRTFRCDACGHVDTIQWDDD